MSVPPSSVIRSLIPDIGAIANSRFAKLARVQIEEQLKRFESGKELMSMIRQSHDAISLAEDNKHVGQAATELAKSIAHA